MSYVFSTIEKNKIDESLNTQPKIELPKSFFIEYPKKYNYRQGYNECGPYNVAATIRILKEEDVDGAKIANEMSFRFKNGYSLPPGLEEYLVNQSLIVKTYFLKNRSDTEKVNLIKDNISENKPIIILGENYRVQHYMTILGYEDSQGGAIFSMYDPLYTKGEDGFTIDDNGDKPGNRDLTQTELFDFWSGGGMIGFYEWYAIVVSN